MKSPVLLLIFNRPSLTELVLNSIRLVKPNKLYIAADGPRKNKINEIDECNQARKIALNIDWDCEVITLFRDENLGCKKAVSSAISWFFEHEAEGIVLEDDCLPHEDFFRYCDLLLERYREDERIGLISGTSLCDLDRESMLTDGEDYFYNRYPSIWGWASWKRVWNDYDPKISSWLTKQNDVINLIPSKTMKKINRKIFDNVFQDEIDTWDYQVSYMLWLTGRMAIAPKYNLVQNIGFGCDATHTKNKSSHMVAKSKIDISNKLIFPLRGPLNLTPNYLYSKWIEKESKLNLTLKIFNKLKNIYSHD